MQKQKVSLPSYLIFSAMQFYYKKSKVCEIWAVDAIINSLCVLLLAIFNI